MITAAEWLAQEDYHDEWDVNPTGEVLCTNLVYYGKRIREGDLPIRHLHYRIALAVYERYLDRALTYAHEELES